MFGEFNRSDTSWSAQLQKPTGVPECLMYTDKTLNYSVYACKCTEKTAQADVHLCIKREQNAGFPILSNIEISRDQYQMC